MGQYFGRQTHGDAFYPLGQHDGEFHGEGDGLFFPTVVAGLPAGGLAVEGDVERELAQARLDVTGGRRRIAGAHIAPVTLGFDEEVLLPQAHHRIANGRIAMGMVLHGLPDDVGDFIESAVVDHLHGMQNPALHRLQAIFDGWHGALQDHIRSILKEPIFVQSRHRSDVVDLLFFSLVGVEGCFFAHRYFESDQK